MQDKQGSLLIIDDNEEFLLGLRMLLSSYFKDIEIETNPEKALYQLDKHRFDLILLDMNFRAGLNSGNEGFFWMDKILAKDPGIRIIFITGFGDVGLAVESMKKGVSDFIEKSWEERKILSTVLANFRLCRSISEAKQHKEQRQALSEYLDDSRKICRGSSAMMSRTMDMIRKVAPTDANILLIGESGTGKELLAHEIHRLSDRSEEIFIPVDLGAIPPTLFESELFGFAKGAFTDAFRDKPGKIETAERGTLFLDEIGNLPLMLQAKLLGVLQQKSVTRLGESKSRTINFRLISATNASLPEMIAAKTFREDLYYRVRTVEVTVPPLRERMEDIPDLVDFFIQEFTKKYHRNQVKLEKSAIKKLQEYHWPGNIRELQHQVEKAIIMNDTGTLTGSDFDLGSPHITGIHAGNLNLEEHEKYLIAKAIEKFKGNLTKAASELGINRSTLYDKIKKYEIRPL